MLQVACNIENQNIMSLIYTGLMVFFLYVQVSRRNFRLKSTQGHAIIPRRTKALLVYTTRGSFFPIFKAVAAGSFSPSFSAGYPGFVSQVVLGLPPHHQENFA
jgi:hypothetical protein